MAVEVYPLLLYSSDNIIMMGVLNFIETKNDFFSIMVLSTALI